MRSVPGSTYRVQVTPERPLAAVVDRLDHLRSLGITHVYLSPLLTATPGSTHGYDVIDHASISAELGGLPALTHLHSEAAARGLGLVLDIVPNHMAIPVPEHLNSALWSVLREGPSSDYRTWFDVDWSAERPLLLPVLGDRIDLVLERGEIELDGTGGPDGEPVLRYGDHVFPVRNGTSRLGLVELLDAQFYRLAYWRLADEELNYRRFFDVDTLVGIRVEDPDVFARTHKLVGSLVREGVVDGLRIDHPDGLADPREYLRRLHGLTDGAWVVVEKILEPGEELPTDWECAGTTGYDAATHIGGVFVDPAAEAVLTQAFLEAVDDPRGWEETATDSRREVLAGLLATEVDRLGDVAHAICQEHVLMRDHSHRGLVEALTEMLVTVPVYRAYVQVGEDPAPASVRILESTAATCRERLPERASEIDLIRDLALGRHGRSSAKDEFVRRFQQTCGPAIAKGVEDTACFRWFPLVSLAEVGSRPDRFRSTDEDVHAWAVEREAQHPASLTALSTHDSKRSEDVRARIAVISEIPGEWLTATRAWQSQAGAFTGPDGSADPRADWLLWQTLVGAWPIDADRLAPHLVKAAREAKLRTSWTSPDVDYEKALVSHVEQVLGDEVTMTSVRQVVERMHPGFVTNVLGQRALQLMLPGVPDVYQGCEVVNLRLTDPDNRGPVDTASVDESLARAADAELDPWSDLDAAKARLTTLGLRLRSARAETQEPALGHRPIVASGSLAHHVLGFARGDLCISVSRYALRLQASGGWDGTTVAVPEGRWRDALTGAVHDSDGALRAADLHARWPATILVQEDA
jgi:(1->4)-alpha-D-glucan 1-alpha-D-glucosylmutase